MAFVQLAQPGLQKLGGRQEPGLPSVEATLTESLRGQSDWTQFILGGLSSEGAVYTFTPIRMKSRLQSMAHADGIATVPEGVESIPAGSTVKIQMLT
jgi:molybdopterin biosynthesis enzyme